MQRWTGWLVSWRRLTLIWLLPILVVGVTAVQAHSTPGGVISAKWILSLVFDNHAIIATRTNQIYNNATLIDEWTQTVPCFPVGAVTLDSDRAIFNGGHVQCDLPSFRAEVFVHTMGQVVLGSTCTNAGRRVDFWGQTTVANVGLPLSNSHPLVHHPDYQVLWTLLPDTGGATTRLGLTAGPMITLSPSFAPPSGDYDLASRLHQCNGASCHGRHWLNGGLLINQIFAQGAPWNGTSLPTTLFIGTDGANVFLGEMLDIAWDPGCIVRQG